MERLEHALQSFEQAISSDPLNVDAYVDRATTLIETGRTEEALAAFEAALTIAPGLVSAHYNRAVALLHVGRLDEALVGINETLKSAPDHLGALNNRGVILLTLNCPDEALASFDRALAIAKSNPETLEQPRDGFGESRTLQRGACKLRQSDHHCAAKAGCVLQARRTAGKA